MEMFISVVVTVIGVFVLPLLVAGVTFMGIKCGEFVFEFIDKVGRWWLKIMVVGLLCGVMAWEIWELSLQTHDYLFK